MGADVPEDLDAFWQVLATVFGHSGQELRENRDSTLAELGIDEVSLFRIVLDLQSLNRHFDIPAQADVRDTTLDDLWHYFTVMTHGHRGSGT